MKIDLKNIGTVKQAKIDLDKNLLIFCGPNNTGKTYVAYTLYGLFENQLDLTKKNDLIESIITSTFKEGEMSFIFETDVVNAILVEKEIECTNELSNVFATTQAFFSSASISIATSTEEILKKIKDLTFQSSFSTTYYNCTITKIPGSNTASIKTIKNAQEVTKNDRQNTYEFIASIIKRAILRAFLKDRYIAPAERIAINIFSKELSLNRNEIVDSIVETADPITGLNDKLKKLKRYSLPIRDSIKVAEDLSNLQKYRSDYYFLAEQIERKILNGKIDVSANGDMQFSPNDSDIKSLDIHLSGSMIKSLSSLVFYFRHLAIKGDFIIIDEPELNLHPDNQIIMARILARIVNEGFKVLISTHSDYIIKELNNLVRLDSRKEEAKEIMDKYGYEKEELLARDVLGVYLFKNNMANLLEVDELGFDVSTIEKVNSELAQISESIYFDLLDQDE
jgi:predicted ATPase